MRKMAIASRLLCRSGLRRLLHGSFRWSGVLALNYHRIGDAEGSDYDRELWSASAEAFAEQMRFCNRQMEIISPSDLPGLLERKRGRYAMITFDDGYRDNYEVAFPILKDEGVPATFFVSTDFVDAPALSWWDEIAWMIRTSQRSAIQLAPWLDEPLLFDEPGRETAVRVLLRKYKTTPGNRTGRYLDDIAAATGTGRCPDQVSAAMWMTWDMLREMKAAGMTIGGHSLSHPVLSRLTPQEQRHEIVECGRRLEQELGEPMHSFSYPVGSKLAFDVSTRESLREAGVIYAFSYYGGYRRFDDWDDYDIRRVAIEEDVDSEWFRSMITLPQIFG